RRLQEPDHGFSGWGSSKWRLRGRTLLTAQHVSQSGSKLFELDVRELLCLPGCWRRYPEDVDGFGLTGFIASCVCFGARNIEPTCHEGSRDRCQEAGRIHGNDANADFPPMRQLEGTQADSRRAAPSCYFRMDCDGAGVVPFGVLSTQGVAKTADG